MEQDDATVLQDGDTFPKGLHGHEHPSQPGRQMTLKTIADVNRKAKDNIFSSAADIVGEIMVDLTTSLIPDQCQTMLLEQPTGYVRRCDQRSQLPSSLISGTFQRIFCKITSGWTLELAT